MDLQRLQPIVELDGFRLALVHLNQILGELPRASPAVRAALSADAQALCQLPQADLCVWTPRPSDPHERPGWFCAPCPDLVALLVRARRLGLIREAA